LGWLSCLGGERRVPGLRVAPVKLTGPAPARAVGQSERTSPRLHISAVDDGRTTHVGGKPEP